MDLNLHNLRFLHPRSLGTMASHVAALIESRLWLKVLVAMALGVLCGVLLGPAAGYVQPSLAQVITNWLALPGQVFLVLVQMIVVPLVVASIVQGIASSDNMEDLKKSGLFATSLFVISTTGAIVLGIALAMALKPGELIDPTLMSSLTSPLPAAPTASPSNPILGPSSSIPEALAGLLPKNPLQSMVNLEMLQVVMFSAIVAVALVSLPTNQALPLLSLLETIQQVCMIVVGWAMRMAPLAVFGLMTQISSKLGLSIFVGLSAYLGTVLLGLVLVNLSYFVIYRLVTGRKMRVFFKAIRELQLLAFSTSSSAAVMPVSIRVAEDKLGIRPSIAQFVIPLGATVNMNGTALYQGVATIFLAQIFNVDLSMGALVLLVVTSVASSIGSPATPGVGITILAMVLGSVGIPAAGIGLIMGVDRVVDMSRTAVNVAGDLTVAAVLDRMIPTSPPSSPVNAEDRS